MSDELATPDQAAEHLKVNTSTLAQWRYLGRGPRFIKVGRRVRYRWTELEEWLQSQTHSRSGDAA